MSKMNVITPKKRYHRRKCSEPFKNERVQTRQSRSITLMQKKSEDECLSQISNTVTCIPLERDEQPEEKVPAEESECSIVCTPDINMNDQVEETFSDENQNLAISTFDKKKNDELGYNEGQHAVNFVKSSSADKISLCKKNDCKSTASTNSRISSKETSCSIAKTKYPQPTKKRGQENADGNPKRKLRHVNAQAMPVYMNRIAFGKNENQSTSHIGESLLLTRTRNNGNKCSDTDHIKAEKGEDSPVVIEMETQHCLNDISLHSKMGKTTDIKYSYLSNTDSEETLSNVESVPNSPAQEIWPKVAGKNLKLSNKCMKLNSGQSSTRRRGTSLAMHRIPAGVDLSIMENGNNAEVNPICKRKSLQPDISSTLNCSTKRDETELQYYVETSANKNLYCVSDGTEKNTENDVGNTDLGGSQETPWLRHYERPHKTRADTVKNATEFEDDNKENCSQPNQKLYHRQKKDVKTTKKSSYISNAGSSASDNLQAAERHSIRKRSGKHPQPANNQPFRKRGRPRKQDAQSSKVNLDGKKSNGPSVSRAVPNGSGLSKLELERLFFKFLQHGHFGVVPGQPPIIIHNNDLYEHVSTRMQCHDPRKYYMHPHNGETQSNSESKTYSYSQQHFPTHNDANRFYPSNNPSSGKTGHKVGTMNPNSHNFSNELVGPATYSGNLSPCSMHTNFNSCTNSEKAVINTSSYNAPTCTNSVSNYMQSGYGTTSNYHQNFYNNNANVMGNNFYSNNYCGIVNSNGSLNNTNTGTAVTNLLSTTNNFDDDINFILNTQHQHQNSIPCRQIDINMSDGNRVSSNSVNSMQNSPTNNVSPDWNLGSRSQHLDSVNGLHMDLNSVNDTNDLSSTMDGSPDLNNIMNNSNSTMNGVNPWMNKSNNMMNPPFAVLPPWHTSLPMYNSYLNNGNQYYNNMFNPYAAILGFDASNHPYSNMNPRNSMGINNENSWMCNILPNSDRYSSFTATTSTEFSNVNSDLLQENSLNQGMNLSLSGETIFPQTNSMELVNDTNLDMEHDNGLNLNIEQPKENPFALVETENNIVQKSNAQGSSEQICLPNSSGYKNDMQNLNFNNVEIVKIDSNNIENQQQQNISQIQDYMNQKSNNLGSCINQSYNRTGLPNCDILTDLPNNKETEMSKLRQELADFTRQYSEDQTSPTSQIPQGDEIFI